VPPSRAPLAPTARRSPDLSTFVGQATWHAPA
jgi:hypothetical protein